MTYNLLYESLKKFYSNTYNRDTIINILNGDYSISLRSIDWFITNYSKKNNTIYSIYEDENKLRTFDSSYKFKENINVFHSYKSQLKAYSKKLFDPFCRRDRIEFELNNNVILETTLGQLNFFRWAINNLIVNYIKDNKNLIETDMNICLKTIKKENNPNERKKRQELSLSATRGLNMNHITTYLSFE